MRGQKGFLRRSIHRLPKYYRHLQDLRQGGSREFRQANSRRDGFQRFSNQAGFQLLRGGFGQQATAYQVSVLLREIAPFSD
jgi:NADH/NAD ratio-sensing transcriptional regulator Rex